MVSVKPYLILTILAAASAGFLFGINTGNIAGALPFLQTHYHMNTLQSEWVVSSTILFAFLSAFASAKICKNGGHRSALLFTAICFVIGAFLAGTSQSLWELVLGRSLLGIAIGISSYAAPLYISEIALPRYRGFFVLLNGLAITGGEAIAFYLDFHWGKTGQWRPMLWWCVIPGLIFFVSMMLMPHAPRWLLSKGKLTLAKNVLLKFHPPAAIASLVDEMQRVKTLPHFSLKQIFRYKPYRYPLITGIGLGIFQQFFGINAIMYYGPYIFETAGFSLTETAIWVTFIMGIVNMVMTLLTGLLVDQCGRRMMLLIGSAIACISLFIISILFNSTLTTWHSFYIVIFMIVYIIGYCMSVGSLFWLIISEIFPLNIRDQGASLATSIQWLSNFVISFSFLSILQFFGPHTTFLMFSIICLGSFVFIFRYVPETKQQSLEAIHLNMHGLRGEGL